MAGLTIVVMGVAGCGKTAIGSALARQLGYRFHDGDDYHPPANVNKMRAGIPLTDDDREGWLDRLRELIVLNEAQSNPIVLACSALRERYRSHLSGHRGADCPANDNTLPRFVHLVVTPEVAEARLRARSGHFMPASLIKSQFDTLEVPQSAIRIDATQPVHEVLRQVAAALNASK